MIKPGLITATRKAITTSLEDIGGVATRLREIEEGIGFADAGEEIVEWLTTASETLAQAAVDFAKGSK